MCVCVCVCLCGHLSLHTHTLACCEGARPPTGVRLTCGGGGPPVTGAGNKRNVDVYTSVYIYKYTYVSLCVCLCVCGHLSLHTRTLACCKGAPTRLWGHNYGHTVVRCAILGWQGPGTDNVTLWELATDDLSRLVPVCLRSAQVGTGRGASKWLSWLGQGVKRQILDTTHKGAAGPRFMVATLCGILADEESRKGFDVGGPGERPGQIVPVLPTNDM